MTYVCLLVTLSSGVAQVDSLDVFDRANELLENRQYEEALRAYEFFLSENPDHHLVPAAKWAIANIFFTVKQDYYKASIVYQNIVSKYRDTGWEIFSLDRLGSCYERQNKWEEATRVYESALARLAEPVHSALAEDWNDVFNSKLLACYRRLGDQYSMVSIYERSLEADPGGPRAPQYQFELASVLLEMNETKAAASQFAGVVDRYPLSGYAEMVRVEHHDLLVSQLGYDWIPFSIFNNSVELSRSGQFDEAHKGFDRVIEEKHATGMDCAARFQQALIMFRRTGDAVTLSDMVRTKRDEFPYGLGGIDEERFIGVLDAIIEAEKTTTSGPENAEAYRRMASAYYETQAYYPAIETYKRAIEHDPGNSGLLNMLGYCYIGIGAYDDAINTFSKVLESAPDDPNSYDSMAEAYFKKGDSEQAIRYYEKAVSVDANFTNPYYMLGEIYHGMNKDDVARDYLQRYLELDPDGFRAEAARIILNQIDAR